jgi:peroxiredoxin
VDRYFTAGITGLLPLMPDDPTFSAENNYLCLEGSKTMTRFISIFLLMFIISLPACSPMEAPKPAVEGQQAPDFILDDISGVKTRLSDLKGEVVLVNFWATWCPPCRDEIPSMVALNRLMVGKPFRMLAISMDQGGENAVNDFFRRSGLMLPVLLDSDGKVGKLYGVTGVPETFVIDRKGVIIKKIIGPLDWSAPEVVNFLTGAMQ